MEVHLNGRSLYAYVSGSVFRKRITHGLVLIMMIFISQLYKLTNREDNGL